MDRIGPDHLETATPASAGAARRLTTKEKVKAALGETVTTYDSLIDGYIDQVSDDVARYCGLEADAVGSKPTFGAEALRATWYQDWSAPRGPRLQLPWRPPVTSIAGVTETGVDLVDGADYRLDRGELLRLRNDAPAGWCFGKIVVELMAGWSLPTGVPPGLEMWIVEQVKLVYFGRRRDPAIRAETVFDVHQVQLGVAGGDSIGKSGLLTALEAALTPYRRIAC